MDGDTLALLIAAKEQKALLVELDIVELDSERHPFLLTFCFVVLLQLSFWFLSKTNQRTGFLNYIDTSGKQEIKSSSLYGKRATISTKWIVYSSYNGLL